MSDIKTNEAPAQELSEILQVRRDKLTALQQEGRDPFEQTKFVRSAYSADIKADYFPFNSEKTAKPEPVDIAVHKRKLNGSCNAEP